MPVSLSHNLVKTTTSRCLTGEVLPLAVEDLDSHTHTHTHTHTLNCLPE